MILWFNASVTIATFILIGFAFLPITILIGLTAFTKLLSIKARKRILILGLIAIPNIIFEILLFYFYFTDLSFIATVNDALVIKYSLFSQIYFMISLLVFLVTGIVFSQNLLRSNERQSKIKGKLLLTAFISFVAGTILDFSLSLTITYVIARIILVSSSIEFYMGLIFPEWTKKLFFK